MNFESEFTSEFSDDHVKKDHSPNKIPTHDDFLSSAAKISNPADDFEHIGSKIDAEYDLLDGGFNHGYKTNETAADLLGDFKSNIPPAVNTDHVDPFDSFNKTKESTMDFMAAERNHVPRMNASPPAPPVVPVEVPSAPMKTSIYDELENDYLNPYASTKNNEKFISSEDLLSDFKDVAAEARTITPDFFKEPVESFDKPKVVVLPVQPVIPKPVQVTPAPVPKPVAPVEIKKEISHSKVEDIPEPVKATKPKQKEEMISAEEMFYKFGLDAWFKPERLHPKVESLIYWRDPKKSGVVFGTGLVILLAVSCFSVISVFAYTSLLALFGTIAFRIYKNVLQAVQKTSEGHPFKDYLEYELAIPQEKVSQVANVGVAHFNAFLAELRRLFLVEDLVDSIKFGVLLWGLTYLGSWFNGMTLVILGFVALFTLPKVYENNKQSIDTYLDLVRSKILEITDKVKAAVPIGKKPESDKKEN
ncbi:reticulon-1 isoform X1 [Bradysia coprophila]|uniref:reticulon-1 isoform X1 n=1 Tax=Bradysia coprophila TaxID=38358 RepID=UPI00187DB0F3|nr:reticulon-1 isoform X1 [Bradysia coprophila]